MCNCKCGKEMTVLATESRLPGAYNARNLKKPFSGTIWWCPECGRVCAKGELIGDPPEEIDPIWHEPSPGEYALFLSSEELPARRWIMGEISGWNNCMDNDRLAEAFIIAQEKIREFHRRFPYWQKDRESGETL